MAHKQIVLKINQGLQSICMQSFHVKKFLRIGPSSQGRSETFGSPGQNLALKLSLVVTACTQRTGTYLSLVKNTDTPNVVVMVTRD